MHRLRLALWLMLAWPLPALVAGALGWPSIWGSGSALGDYLVPLPVAGGALHVPSFLLGAWALAALPTLRPPQALLLRATMLGVALAGALWLVNLDAWFLAQQANATLPPLRAQQNPLGLFLLSDGLCALLLGAGAGPAGRARVGPLPLVALLLPMAAPVLMAQPARPGGEPFQVSGMRTGMVLGDMEVPVYTTLDTAAPGFRERALAWAQAWSPTMSGKADDLALQFTPNFQAARRADASHATATLCLYADGTPPQWHAGAAAEACFAAHVGFSERFNQALRQRPDGEPNDLRHHFAASEVCQPGAHAAGAAALRTPSALQTCESLARAREILRERFPGDARLQEPLPR